MTIGYVLPILIGLCAFLILIVCSTVISGFLRKRKSVKSIETLLESVKSEEEARISEISSMLKSTFKYQEDAAKEETSVFISKENQFYQAMINVYGDKTNAGIESLPLYVSSFVEPYKQIKLPKSEVEQLGELQLAHDKAAQDLESAQQIAKDIFAQYMISQKKEAIDTSQLSLDELLEQVSAQQEANASNGEEVDPNLAVIETLTQERDTLNISHAEALMLLNLLFKGFSKFADIEIDAENTYTADEITKLLPPEYNFERSEGDADATATT